MYYAEFETDKYIRETFFKDTDYKGTMIEVGAGPSVFFSMSKHFRDTGWRCICIDPNPKFYNEHKEKGNEIYNYACSNYDGQSTFKIVSSGWESDKDGISYSGLDIKYDMPNYPVEQISVEVIKLNTLLENINVESIDFLSVDVEGWELEVMGGFNIFKYKPKVVLLENYTYNSSYIDYMESVGYYLHNKLDYNYIFTY